MIVDFLEKEIRLKIVYFGPALSGKTTSIKALFTILGLENKVLCIETTTKRTLFYDHGVFSCNIENLFPIGNSLEPNDEEREMAHNMKGWNLKFHIYTTTGQDYYLITRPITLKAVDGLIFVADSQKETYDRNITSWNELSSYFSDPFITLPKLIAFNKQDLSNKFNPDEFLQEIDYNKYKNIEIKYTSAINGKGIFSVFKTVLKLMYKREK